jgi:hypothetical protein
MKKFIISASIAVFALTGSAFAKQEVSVTRTVWEISDFPELTNKVKAVCESKVVMSDKLKEACKDNAKLPKVTKAGAFRNTGMGAELNTLIRQSEPVKAEAPKADGK